MAATILIAAGGTGGHLFPGIAVADELVRRDSATRVVFAGTKKGLETRLVPKAGYRLELLPILPLNAISPWRTLVGLAALPWGMLRSFGLVLRLRPSAVLGIGGYAGGPVTLAAALLGVHTVVLEPNAKPGFTNRVLRPFVRVAACAYDEARLAFGAEGRRHGQPGARRLRLARSEAPRAPADAPRLRRQPGLAHPQPGAAGRAATAAAGRAAADRAPDGTRDAGGGRERLPDGGTRGGGGRVPRRHGAPLRRGRSRARAQPARRPAPS